MRVDVTNASLNQLTLAFRKDERKGYKAIEEASNRMLGSRMVNSSNPGMCSAGKLARADLTMTSKRFYESVDAFLQQSLKRRTSDQKRRSKVGFWLKNAES